VALELPVSSRGEVSASIELLSSEERRAQASSVEDNPDMKPEVTAKAKATVAPYRGDNSWGFFGAGKRRFR
jgi:hypothetical protein